MRSAHSQTVPASNSLETSAKPRRKRWWTKDDTELSLITLPTVIWFLLFSYLPMFGIIIAFKNYRITPGTGFLTSLIKSPWAGLENFKFIIKSGSIWVLLRNTFAYNIAFIILGIVVPVACAILLNELHSRKWSRVYQTMTFFPHFLSWVVVAFFVYALLAPGSGIFSRFLANHGNKVNFYQSPQYWPWILIFTNLWKGLGNGMVVYLASISGIDTSMYEAALIDGASKVQQARYITLPSLKPVIIIMFILSVGRIFYTDFGLFYYVTQMIPASLFSVASTLDTYVYSALMNSSIPVGQTAAVTFFQSVSCCITILLANFIVKKLDPDSAFI